MNVNDVRIAAEDLVEANIANPLEGVHVKGIHGAERINSFDVVETDGFTGVFVLDSRGEPAVSSTEYGRLKTERDELYSIALWAARRMLTRQYSAYVYDEIEKVIGEEVDRDWRGVQV